MIAAMIRPTINQVELEREDWGEEMDWDREFSLWLNFLFVFLSGEGPATKEVFVSLITSQTLDCELSS